MRYPSQWSVKLYWHSSQQREATVQARSFPSAYSSGLVIIKREVQVPCRHVPPRFTSERTVPSDRIDCQG